MGRIGCPETSVSAPPHWQHPKTAKTLFTQRWKPEITHTALLSRDSLYYMR